jgi:tRNA (cmo5U34)-methyltransferase
LNIEELRTVKDRIFREPVDRLAGFEFNDEVAAVFDDMLDRSIPFYQEIQAMIVDFVGYFYQAESWIYDLGCSTGLTIAKLLAAFNGIEKIVGVDTSQPMIDKSRQRLADLPGAERVELVHGDIREIEIQRASVVIMNYTLQFIRPLYRERVVRAIYEGLQPGGALMLSEKVLEESTLLSRLFVDMYYRFKRKQGYSELEISQKRERLENVLVPYQVNELRELLSKAGFDHVDVFFKWHNFASLIAIKGLK